jgi:cytidylate kinase
LLLFPGKADAQPGALRKNLIEELNRRRHGRKNSKEWDYINKELLQKAARELNVKPSEIAYVFKYQERNALGDIFASYANKYYKSDRKIRKTIADVIRSIAIEGNIIIIGRAGVVLTKDIPGSLHISLEAPLEWRSLMISETMRPFIRRCKKVSD